MERLIRNLIENAVRYATDTVHVTLSGSEGFATLVVEDDGHGIALEDRERVLDRFTRLDEARDRAHGGTGLGLAIATEVVDRHHGTLVVEESRSGGAQLRVELPVQQPS